MPVPTDVDECLSKLIRRLNLTGQFAFDYFRETATGNFYIIECNPRGSSVLEVVSTTPGWGRAFFGVEVPKSEAVYAGAGFWFHRNCYPFGGKACAHRHEAIFSWRDPLPFFVGEFLFLLELIRTKGLLRGWHHVDANIGKIIVPGKSPGRNFDMFKAAIDEAQAATACIIKSTIKEVPGTDEQDALFIGA